VYRFSTINEGVRAEVAMGRHQRLVFPCVITNAQQQQQQPCAGCGRYIGECTINLSRRGGTRGQVRDGKWRDS